MKVTHESLSQRMDKVSDKRTTNQGEDYLRIVVALEAITHVLIDIRDQMEKPKVNYGTFPAFPAVASPVHLGPGPMIAHTKEV